METVSKLDSLETGYYPIRTVAELTGVNAITLRAWERRYALFEPVRKSSGHRLYTQEHIDLINRVVGLLERGVRIGQVKSHLESAQTRTGESGVVDNFWQRALNRMIAAVIQFDEAGLEDTYGDALSVHTIQSVTERLLTPLLHELGRRWEAGEGSVAEEHFFACYLRNKLGARFHHRARTQHGPKLLLACLPGDRHETGLLLYALAANDAGYRVVLLGADVPLEELLPAARKTGCAAIVLSGVMPPPANVLKTDLPALTARAEVPVFLGGQASVAPHDALKRAGVEPLGTHVEQGLRRMGELLERHTHKEL